MRVACTGLCIAKKILREKVDLGGVEGGEELLAGTDEGLLSSTKLDLSLGTTGLGDELDLASDLGVGVESEHDGLAASGTKRQRQ